MRKGSFHTTFRWTSMFIVSLVITLSLHFTGCYPEKQESGSSGCGTQMGCCPATGCGSWWFGNVTRLCYPTANACNQAGNNQCRQCY